MEAQACGLPVLSTTYSGIAELVADGESGFLVPERHANTVSHRLVDLVDHPDICSTMGSAGRRIVHEHFNMEPLNVELEQIYEQARERFHRQFATTSYS